MKEILLEILLSIYPTTKSWIYPELHSIQSLIYREGKKKSIWFRVSIGGLEVPVYFCPPPFPRIRRNRARCEVMQVAFPPVVPGDWKSLLSLSQIAFLDCLVTSSYSGHLWTTPARGTNEEGSVKACIAKASSNYQRLQGSKQLFLYCVY